MNSKYLPYTGVGSRDITKKEKSIIFRISKYLAHKDFTLRSGKAAGADTAFQIGAQYYSFKVKPEIYTPWCNFRLNQTSLKNDFDFTFDNALLTTCEEIAKEIHPNWYKMTKAGKLLHSRNVLQVLGKNLDSPSKFLIFCSDQDSKGEVKGGTRTAVVLGKEYGIPCFNIRDNDQLHELEIFIFRLIGEIYNEF